MSELLNELADKLNINTTYSYFCSDGQKHVAVDDNLLRFFIEDMGYKASNDVEIKNSIERISKKRWQRAMEAIYVREIDALSFDIVLSKDEKIENVSLVPEGKKKFFNVSFNADLRENYRGYVCYDVAINDELEPGYYNLCVKTNTNEYSSLFAVAPKTCYHLNKGEKDKLFGFAIQLYSLRSKRNWGIGDFTDLETMVDMTAGVGGDVIGLNPLNVLLHDYPECASPYASISRLFINPIYIDVERVPLYQKSDKDEPLVKSLQEKENIDYTGVYNAKIKVLEAVFKRFNETKDAKYKALFEKFKEENGKELQQLAVFQSIAHVRAMNGGKLPVKEEKSLSQAFQSGVEKFAKEHSDEIEFFKFLQFEADRQLKEVEKRIKKKGFAIGLYRDIPVGVSKDSAEVWSDKYLYIQKSGAGVPPDSYFPTGQKWGLGAFNPFELKERCYKPYIKILRANMRYAGAVRIDHIMGLSRLFIMPDDGKFGTYIRYNSKDMMNILALESYLNKCVVVGECIGNVEDGYTQSLLDKGIYLLGVLWSERKDERGTMRRPDEYEEKYFASVGTHDMPPLKAWWFGKEIATMKRLKLFTDKETEDAYHRREDERRLLLDALDKENVWPSDRMRHGDYIYGESFPEGIDEAVHGYMAKSKSEVLLLMPEDIFQSEKIQNLPGTDVDKYPNWRSKQVIDLEDMEEDEHFKRHIQIVRSWR